MMPPLCLHGQDDSGRDQWSDQPLEESALPPFRCTYRIQLNADFTFSDLTGIASYLRKLGVSHAYLSPILEAAPGSTHGYDVADPTRISERLGGESGFVAAAEALRAQGVGIVLDIVPNHL